MLELEVGGFQHLPTPHFLFYLAPKEVVRKAYVTARLPPLGGSGENLFPYVFLSVLW